MQRTEGHFPRRASSITPSDTYNLPPTAILVVDGGDVVVQPFDNDAADTVTLTAVPAYFTVPFEVKRVLATGTTATDIVGIS